MIKRIICWAKGHRFTMHLGDMTTRKIVPFVLTCDRCGKSDQKFRCKYDPKTGTFTVLKRDAKKYQLTMSYPYEYRLGQL